MPRTGTVPGRRTVAGGILLGVSDGILSVGGVRSCLMGGRCCRSCVRPFKAEHATAIGLRQGAVRAVTCAPQRLRPLRHHRLP